MREALAHSLNVATVKVAETVGYDAVVDMANRAGMNYKIQPTPAVALGAYDITPLEAAGAYTMFANQGDYVKPSFVRLVRSDKGQTMFKNTVEHKQVLDPRVAYLMTNLMEEVLRSGTGAGVRGPYKFYVPAAGKTGTSRDGWFAGYTTELLCVVWVGFDDNRDLDLEGAHSAAPIWAEFMTRALEYREYRDAKPFRAPEGIVSIEIDPESGYPATALLPHAAHRSLHCRHRTGGGLPAAWREARHHHGDRVGHLHRVYFGRGRTCGSQPVAGHRGAYRFPGGQRRSGPPRRPARRSHRGCRPATCSARQLRPTQKAREERIVPASNRCV